jgi:hypothetical protein
MAEEAKVFPEKIEELFRQFGCVPNDEITSKEEFLDNVFNTLLCGCAEDTPLWVYEFFIEWLDEIAKDTKEGYDNAHKFYMKNSDSWSADQKTIFYLVNGILDNRELLEHGTSTRLPWVNPSYREEFKLRWQALDDKKPYGRFFDPDAVLEYL